MKINNVSRMLLCLVMLIQVASRCYNREQYLLDGWKDYKGALYKKFGDSNSMTTGNYYYWKTFCEGYGGSLATAKTAEENAFISKIFTFTGYSVYIGLTYNRTNWMWDDGTSVIYSNWKIHGGDTDDVWCAVLYMSPYWLSANCSLSLHGMCKCIFAEPCNADTPCTDPHTECNNGTCKCLPGYTLGRFYCISDLNLNSSCDASTVCRDQNAECKTTTSSTNSTCQCKSNYTVVGGICKADLNTLCNTSTGCSDPYAECKATTPGANNTCQCKSNYTDVGSICRADLNTLCNNSTGCSDPYAECKATTPGANNTCQCKSNYTDVGSICRADLNSLCATSTGCSDQYAECKETTSGANKTCQCMSKYTGVGGICKADAENITGIIISIAIPILCATGIVIVGVFVLWRRYRQKRSRKMEAVVLQNDTKHELTIGELNTVLQATSDSIYEEIDDSKRDSTASIKNSSHCSKKEDDYLTPLREDDYLTPSQIPKEVALGVDVGPDTSDIRFDTRSRDKYETRCESD